MNRIFLKMYMHQNLGDDLFLQVLLERYPDTGFYLYADQAACKGFSRYENLWAARPRSLRIRGKLGGAFGRGWHASDRLASLSAATVLLGGSLFMDPICPGIRNDLFRKDLPYFVLGVNYGPEKTEEYRDVCRSFFSGKTDVCFRDSASYELFRDIPGTRLATDILFGLEKYALSQSTGQGENSTLSRDAGHGKKSDLFVSVIDLPARWEHAKEAEDPLAYRGQHITSVENAGVMLEYRELKEILRTLRAGKRVTLASFCDTGGDWEAVCRIVTELRETFPEEYRLWREKKQLRVLRYRGAADEREKILRSIAGSERVIGGRYHSIVLGLLFGKPVLPICYNIKSENLLTDLGFADKIIRLCDTEDGKGGSRRAEFEPEDYIRISPEKRDALAGAAEEQFMMLDRFIAGRGGKVQSMSAEEAGSIG